MRAPVGAFSLHTEIFVVIGAKHQAKRLRDGVLWAWNPGALKLHRLVPGTLSATRNV